MKQLYEDGLQIKAGYQSHITSFTRSVMKKNLLRGEHIFHHTHTPLCTPSVHFCLSSPTEQVCTVSSKQYSSHMPAGFNPNLHRAVKRVCGHLAFYLHFLTKV